MKRTWILFLGLVVMSGCAPLRVATRGAKYYHQPECKYVENSLKRYGADKRVHFYTSLGVNLSGRIPCPNCNAEIK